MLPTCSTLVCFELCSFTAKTLISILSKKGQSLVSTREHIRSLTMPGTARARIVAVYHSDRSSLRASLSADCHVGFVRHPSSHLVRPGQFLRPYLLLPLQILPIRYRNSLVRLQALSSLICYACPENPVKRMSQGLSSYSLSHC